MEIYSSFPFHAIEAMKSDSSVQIYLQEKLIEIF